LQRENKRLSKRVSVAGALTAEVDSMIGHFEQVEETQSSELANCEVETETLQRENKRLLKMVTQSRQLANSEASTGIEHEQLCHKAYALEQEVLAARSAAAEERERCRSLEVALDDSTAGAGAAVDHDRFQDEALSMTRVALAAKGALVEEQEFCRALEAELDAERMASQESHQEDYLRAEVLAVAQRAALGAEREVDREMERCRVLEVELDSERAEALGARVEAHHLPLSRCASIENAEECTQLLEIAALRAELQRLEKELANADHRQRTESVWCDDAPKGEGVRAARTGAIVDIVTWRWSRLGVQALRLLGTQAKISTLRLMVAATCTIAVASEKHAASRWARLATLALFAAFAQRGGPGLLTAAARSLLQESRWQRIVQLLQAEWRICGALA